MQAIKELSSFFNTVRQSIFYFKPIGLDSRKAKEGKILLNDGDTFTFTTLDVEGDHKRVSVTYKVNSIDVLFYMAKKTAKEVFKLKKNDQLVITGGIINGESGNTNLIKLETI